MLHSPKRGQGTGYFLTWIVFTSLMLVLMFGGLGFWLQDKLNPPVETFNLDAALLSQRLLYSPNGLAAVDVLTGRALPGIVDGRKLQDRNTTEKKLLETVFQDDNRGALAARIRIGTATLFYNQVLYDRLSPQIGASGPGSTISVTIPSTVLVRDAKGDTPAQASVEVLRVRG